MYHAMATVPLAPVGILVSQDFQGSSHLASDITEIHEPSPLHHSVNPNPLMVKSQVLQTPQPCSDIFLQDATPPALLTSFPPPGVRFENTAQLAPCSNLLRKCLSSSLAATTTPRVPLDPAQQALIEPYAQSEDESNRIRSLLQRVVEEFVADNLKTTAVLSEILLLVPSLDKEHYRKVLNCMITEFETSTLLDLALLQGMIQLVESASSDYLEPDDLVRILVILRTRLQDTHQQSTKYSYFLAWVLSRLLDVMVEGKVKDLRRVVDQEPLSALFNQMKTSEDPFLKHQATYAFQGLMHIPNDETRRQYMLRCAGNITMGLLGVASVCKLDLGQLKDGADHLYEAAGEIHEVGIKITDGLRSLFESGQGIWASVKGGIFSGGRQLWYTSLREAQQHIRNGRFQAFNDLVFEAPCRDHVNFQWGICQLLGSITVDPLWDTSTRLQAIDFLVELYKNNSIWTPSEHIHRWILNILRMVVALEDSDTTIAGHALLVLQGLEKAGDVDRQKLYRDTLAEQLCAYPVQVHLPIPMASTLLSRVLATPAVEYDLLRLKNRRLEVQENALYIQPQAKPNLQASDDTLFPLMERALDFLAGPGLVFLLLGDSGGGKSTFNLRLERTLWKSYKNGDPIPLHINLPSIDNPQQDMIAKQLRTLDFTDAQIIELKQNRKFIVICDGYDESQLTTNLYFTNQFNQPGQWKVKMVVACRTQYVGSDYRNRFVPQGSSAYDYSAPNSFQEAVIAPFTKEQIQRYVDTYVPRGPRTWRTEDYMDRLTAIPNLMDLVKNPFLLSLALEALPGVTEGKQELSTINITRVQLYDIFVKHWLEVNQRRLERNSALPSVDRDTLSQLIDAGFVSLSTEYSTKLALAIFDKHDGNPVVRYIHFKDKNTWKAEFFGSQAEVRLLRDSSPLTRSGNFFRFIHRSMLEYFFSRGIYSPTENDEEFDSHAERASSASVLLHTISPLFQRNLLQEPSIINFLCDRVKLNPDFKHQLRIVIDRSKTDASAAMAAANAITILVRAGVNFNGVDLRGVKIPNADISGGQFDSAQFQGANLKGVNLTKSWLRQADMSGALMDDVRFGELPYLEMDGIVYSCTYSPDGKMLGVALDNGIINIYDASTWAMMHRLEGHAAAVMSIVFSADNQWLISGSHDWMIRVWDATNGENLLLLVGFSKVISVTISPCGNRIASLGDDNIVRLWSAHTGEMLSVFCSDESFFSRITFSWEGCQLLTRSLNGSIQFWDPMTKGSEISFYSSSRPVAYSPNGRQFAASDWFSPVQLWDAVSLEPGTILRGHTAAVTGIDFSPDGRWIASSSHDFTVRLWDASTSALVTVLTGHNTSVICVAFSPDSCQIASGGSDGRVRLWETGVGWSSLDSQDGGVVTEMGYSRDGQSIFSFGKSRLFRQWDATTGSYASIHHRLPLQDQKTRAFTLDGSQLALGYSSASIRLWDCDTGTAGPILEGHSSWVHKVVYSPCSRWFASVDVVNTMLLWDLHDVELQGLLVDVDRNLFNGIEGVIFSSTGGQFAILTRRGTVRHLDTLTRECLDQLECGVRSFSLVYSPNDQQIAIGTTEGRIHLWDLLMMEPSVILEGHEGRVRCVAYSPCGQWITSGSDDKTVVIWHRQWSDGVESWLRVHSISVFSNCVGHIAWNPVVPMELLTGTDNGSVQLWRMSVDESGKVVFKMVWGSNVDILCLEDAIFTNAVGLSPIYQKLLIQRGAIDFSDKTDTPT